jgi:3-hydroxybutyryl-CoA dehydrogenase
MKNIAVIGGGLMGAGIAQVFAAAGHRVVVYEPDADARATVQTRVASNLQAMDLDPGAADLVGTTSELDAAVGDARYVTEAAPERLELKRALFAQLVKAAPAAAILASNSSVIPIGRIAEGLASADRIVGTHWWNPAPLIPLVEVIQGAQTSAETIASTMALLQSIGKRPAHIRKDIAGFVANRLQHALWREAIAMVAAGVCDAATLDACVKDSFGLRLPVLGPLENADLVGLDLTLDIHRTIIPELDRHAGPHEYLEAQVAAGRLGFKSGIGFRSWTEPQMNELRTRLTRHLVAAAKAR